MPATPVLPVAPRPRRAHPKRSRVTAGIGLLAASALVLSACLGPSAQRSLDLVNGERSSRRLSALAVHAELTRHAQSWAEHLAARGSLAHSDLRGAASGSWSRMGENVGVSSSVDAVHHLFMHSASHRAHILSSGYTHVGIGTATGGDGRTYVVQVFMG
jgi:uncharacterized protein YkwD